MCNQQLNRVVLLLIPPPPTQQHATSMVLKISHKVITKFATVGSSNAGASAMFKLFQARPALLEKRIKQPAVAALSRPQPDSSSNDAAKRQPALRS
jgi:hypothetical protein